MKSPVSAHPRSAGLREQSINLTAKLFYTHIVGVRQMSPALSACSLSLVKSVLKTTRRDVLGFFHPVGMLLEIHVRWQLRSELG